MDIICKALDYTVINTGVIYTMYDDFGNLIIKNSQDMKLDLVSS